MRLLLCLVLIMLSSISKVGAVVGKGARSAHSLTLDSMNQNLREMQVSKSNVIDFFDVRLMHVHVSRLTGGDDAVLLHVTITQLWLWVD
jgi:hypothetical protein